VSAALPIRTKLTDLGQNNSIVYPSPETDREIAHALTKFKGKWASSADPGADR